MSPVESDEEDLTRKQRREQARSERKALEESAAATAARKKRLTQLGSIAAVVIVAVVVIAVATGGGSKAKVIKPGSTGASETEKTVTALIGGIPQNGDALGSPTAPVTLQYFGDLECPICKDFTLGALPSIIKKWVRSGKVRIEYRSLETATREPETFKTQQIAALAAGKQQKMWNFVETFYHEQGEENTGYVTENFIQGIAKQVPGLNLAKWSSDRNDTALANQVAADAQAANNEGFNGTPSFLLGKSGGAMTKVNELSTSQLKESSAYFDPAIEKLLKA
jgi:protein-disulfide isomerase